MLYGDPQSCKFWGCSMRLSAAERGRHHGLLLLKLSDRATLEKTRRPKSVRTCSQKFGSQKKPKRVESCFANLFCVVCGVEVDE